MENLEDQNSVYNKMLEKYVKQFKENIKEYEQIKKSLEEELQRLPEEIATKIATIDAKLRFYRRMLELVLNQGDQQNSIEVKAGQGFNPQALIDDQGSKKDDQENKKLDLQEIKNMKHTLEENITKQMRDFYDKTGLFVIAVDVYDAYGKEWKPRCHTWQTFEVRLERI